jgi:hypothetical protein
VANTVGWPNCDCLGANWSFTLVDPIPTVANTVGWPNYRWMPGTVLSQA